MRGGRCGRRADEGWVSGLYCGKTANRITATVSIVEWFAEHLQRCSFDPWGVDPGALKK